VDQTKGTEKGKPVWYVAKVHLKTESKKRREKHKVGMGKKKKRDKKKRKKLEGHTQVGSDGIESVTEPSSRNDGEQRQG